VTICARDFKVYVEMQNAHLDVQQRINPLLELRAGVTRPEQIVSGC
jgi:hypothetical protein